MDNLLLKIRNLKPDKIQCFQEDGSELSFSMEGKTGQQIRSTLEAESPVKVRLLKGDEILFTWSSDAPTEPPPVSLDYEERLMRLVLKSQETIGKIYQDMMNANRGHIEAILKTQAGVITRLENRVAKLDERLEDSLDVHMDAALNGPQSPPAENTPEPPPVSSDLVNQLVPMLLEALSKKES